MYRKNTTIVNNRKKAETAKKKPSEYMKDTYKDFLRNDKSILDRNLVSKSDFLGGRFRHSQKGSRRKSSSTKGPTTTAFSLVVRPFTIHLMVGPLVKELFVAASLR